MLEKEANDSNSDSDSTEGLVGVFQAILAEAILQQFRRHVLTELLFDDDGNLNTAIAQTLGITAGSNDERIDIPGFLKKQKWFFDMNRSEAEEALSAPGIEVGTYLVRPSSVPTSMVLSVRTPTGVSNDKIDFLEEGGCKVGGKVFPHIVALVNFFKEHSEYTSVSLTQPLVQDEADDTSFEEFEANRDDITLIDKLGEGAFGEVWAGRWKNTDVAVKLTSAGQMSTEAFLEEAKVMHQLQHERLVLLLAVCTEKDPICIITERMPNGDLEKFLREDDGDELDIFKLAKMAAQISSAMVYLEEHKIIHRDLRTANVLVDEDNSVKVADFGLARPVVLQESGDLVYVGGQDCKYPYQWAAPEVMKEKRFSTHSDVWSMGILLYEMCTFGGDLYPLEMQRRPVMLFVNLESGYRLPHPQHHKLRTPDILYNVMLRCWESDPVNRLPFKEMKVFFENFRAKFRESQPRILSVSCSVC